MSFQIRVAKAKLTIDAEATIDGRRRPVTREAQVAMAEPVLVQPPIKGLWAYSNGPGVLDYHTHLHYPDQRYAYDLVIRKEVAGKRATFQGDGETNESYFAWHQPVRAVGDGTVIEVVDNVPDNFGRKANPANKAGRNSSIVIEHSGKRSSMYGHISQGTAVVKVGQKVKAGQSLARVGNAGQSSEPHLHFQYSELDPTGRLRHGRSRSSA